MKKYIQHLITPQQITLIFSDGEPISIFKEDSKYENILTYINQQRFEEIASLVDKSAQIQEYTKGKFIVKNGIVHINNEAIPNELSEKLLQLVDANEETRPLERFWSNLRKNPSIDSKRDLFTFLRVNKIPITPNGCFIAYKKVTDNWLDCHTKTIDNRPGTIVKMERKDVNDDRNVTCAAGLHVAAFSYAWNFTGGILLEVEINPKDVVAVPTDYAHQKMRVCRYRVIRRAEKEIDDLIYKKNR